ncbi:MAG: 2-dehydropantoate 2-reductase, partial [Herpetosiphonaceae bacterium]|nr:2-dehydropantoate 2-reductase [Herpetosiphonaceae bacterium]
MRIGIIGAGGVGGYFGGRLAAAGCAVVWLARGTQLAALQRAGLRVQSQLGDLHLPEVQAFGSAAEIGP